MRKLLNRPWFVVLLALVALWGAWDFLRPQAAGPGGTPNLAESAGPAADGDEADPTAPAAPVGDPVAALKALPIAPTLRDLFAPLPKRAAFDPSVEPTVAAAPTGAAAAPAPETAERFLVSAIWAQPGRTLALLNGRIVEPGETVGRARIESVSPDGVWLVHAGGRELLVPGREFVLRPPTAARSPVAAPAELTASLP